MFQLLVSGFLTVIFLLHFLSPKTIWAIVAVIIEKKVTNSFKVVLKSIGFSTKDNNKSVLQK